MKRTVSITGMSCEHCAARVERALGKIQGVSKASVNLKKAEAVVEGEGFTDEQLKSAVDDAGYEVAGVS